MQTLSEATPHRGIQTAARRPRPGGYSRAATCGADRLLFKTELGLQICSYKICPARGVRDQPHGLKAVRLISALPGLKFLFPGINADICTHTFRIEFGEGRKALYVRYIFI